MGKRQSINNAVLAWVKECAETSFTEDIAWIAVYGSYINGTANERSDVDLYFVPKTQRGYSFAKTFIIDGVGYDIYPRDNANLERLAALHDPLTPCLADVQVIFETDSSYLYDLQKKLYRNLADSEYMRGIADKRFKEACKQSTQNAAITLMTAADCVAALNGTYFRYGLKRQYEELEAMAHKPSGLLPLYDAIITAGASDLAYGYCREMLGMISEFAGFEFCVADEVCDQQVKPSADFDALASLYEEISSTFGKIYTSCEIGNHRLAYLSAACLQNELDYISAAYGIAHFELFRIYKQDHLDRLAERTHEIEAVLIAIIERGGGRIHRFADFKDFAANIV